MKQEKNYNESQKQIIEKCWNIINSILLETREYSIRENHKRGDFDFNIGKHFHGFISFGDILYNKVNFDIWFTKKEKGLPYIKTIILQLIKKTKFSLEVEEYQKTGCIYASIYIPSIENDEKVYKIIYECIDSLLDYFIELNI